MSAAFVSIFRLNAAPAAVGANVKAPAGDAAPAVFRAAGAVRPDPETAKFCPTAFEVPFAASTERTSCVVLVLLQSALDSLDAMKLRRLIPAKTVEVARHPKFIVA